MSFSLTERILSVSCDMILTSVLLYVMSNFYNAAILYILNNLSNRVFFIIIAIKVGQQPPLTP